MSIRGVPVRGLVENPLFLSGVSSWFLAQFTKTVLALFRVRRRRDFLETMFWRTGGMPSSHSALFSAVATSAAFSEGIESNLFVVTFFLAITMMRDALGVRRSTGIQARILNALGRDMAELSKHEFHPVKEIHGHTPLEVITGMLLGVIIASAVAFL
jgi:acid phosphatase family membrane protein YuiD